MKGLLTKDFALFFQRKKTFIFLVAWAVVMCITMDDGSFVIGWMTVISGFFSISSISYDEYDNCYPFIMSLPITPKIYTLEKYFFGIICSLGTWVLSAIIYFSIALLMRNSMDMGSEISQFAIFIPATMALIDVSLPINIKFGSERGRTIILIIWGIVFFGIFGASKLTDLSAAVSSIDISISTFVAFAFALGIVLTILSIAISMKFMQNKEF